MSATGARSPARAEPPAELVARFSEALDRLWPESGRLGLAVSGGPDSLAMLLLADAAIPGTFEVATVDHGLRPESAGECAVVARICAARGIPCEVLRPVVPDGNIQANARLARYTTLGEWAERKGLAAVATAHHADDQAETLVMRLNRGSGVAGLAGVRALSRLPFAPQPVIRPLLAFRRNELEAVIETSGIDPVRDPSNADDRFDRARLRKALAECDWLDPVALAESAAHLADADSALSFHADLTWNESVRSTGETITVRPPPLREIALRVTARAIAQFGGEARGGDIARLLNRLEAGEGGNIGGVLATVEGDDWVFRREPPRRTGA